MAVTLALAGSSCGDDDTRPSTEAADPTTSAPQPTHSSVPLDPEPSSSPSAEPPATEPPTPGSERPEDSAPTGLASWTWTRRFAAEAGFPADTTRSAVAFGAGRFVAVGGFHEQGWPSPNDQVWVSEDGLSWTLANSPDGFQIDDLVHDDALGFVAIGEPKDRAVVWRSPGGEEWVQVEPEWPADFAGTAVAAGPSGLVVVGNVGGQGPGLVEQIEIWGSGDGDDWKRRLLLNDGRRLHVDAVAFGPEGYVAAGVQGGDQLPFVLHSPDGETWEDVSPELSGFFWGATVAHTATHGYLVAFHIGGILLQSDDGVSWRAVDIELGFDPRVNDVSVSDDGSLAVLVGSDTRDYRAAAWILPAASDEVGLVPLSGLQAPIDTPLGAAAFGEDTLVVFGFAEDDALVWIARPPS